MYGKNENKYKIKQEWLGYMNRCEVRGERDE